MTDESTQASDDLEIYISYDRLNASDLGHYLISLSFIANKIADDYFIRFNNPEYEGKEPPTLEIESMYTGNSIKMKLKEGWKPSTKVEDGDFVIYVPKMLGVPLLVAASLVTAAIAYQEWEKNSIEIDIDKIELQLKQHELNKVLRSDAGKDENFKTSVTNYIDHKVPEIKPVLLDTVKSIVGNPNIKQFRVNNIEIKITVNK
jgi:hypothetical protein